MEYATIHCPALWIFKLLANLVYLDPFHSLDYSEAKPRHHVYMHFILYFHRTEILPKTLTVKPLGHLKLFSSNSIIFNIIDYSVP